MPLHINFFKLKKSFRKLTWLNTITFYQIYFKLQVIYLNDNNLSTFFEIIQFLQQGLFQKCEKNRSLNYQNLGFWKSAHSIEKQYEFSFDFLTSFNTRKMESDRVIVER